MNRFQFHIVRFFIAWFSLFPFRVIYFFADITFFVMYHIIRYRRKIVRSNIAGSFPEKTPDEVDHLVHSFYHHFCDIILESLKAFSMSDREMVKRYKLVNAEILDRFYQDKKSVIAVAGHFNNWEWGSISACLQLKHLPVGFYKPLSNPYLDDFIRRNRERNGAAIVSIKKTSNTFQIYKGKPSLFMMVADQSPSDIDTAHWIDFLNRKTAFIHGPEKHSRLNDLPVALVDIEKVKRGYYTVTLKLLTEHPDEVPPEGITRMFAEELEKMIRKNPCCWLWSHRRWKHSYSSPPLR